MIYIFIAFTLSLFAIHYDVNRYKVNNLLILFWWLVFVLLAGLRYRVGADTAAYMARYVDIPVITDLSYKEIISNEFQPFWVILSSLCKSVSKDFAFFQFVHAIITNSIIFYFIKKNTDYFFTGILFYFIFYYLTFNMEILRETLAICVFLFGLKYYFLNKWIIYYSLCVIAFMFHLSAIILFFLPIFKILWTSRSYIMFFIIILIIFILFKNNIIMNILEFIPHEGIRNSAVKYLGATININGIIYISVVNIIIPCFLFYVSEKIVGYKSIFRPFLYVYILIALLSYFLGPFYRFANYITPIYYLFIANLLHEIFRYPPVRKFRYTIVLIIFLLPFSVHLLNIGSSRSYMVPGTRLYTIWYPYHTVFTKKIDINREKLIQAIAKTNGLSRLKDDKK